MDIPKECEKCKDRVGTNPGGKQAGDYCRRFSWNLKKIKNVPDSCKE